MDTIETGTDQLQGYRHNGAGWIVFNNPARRNAVSRAMWEALTPLVATFDADPAVRVIVLRGAGDKAFVSGADISEFETERSGAAAVHAYDARAQAGFGAIENATKPTIAMIRGYCIGGGLGLALACRLRLAADDARFAIPAARLGLGYALDGVRRLVEVAGPANAREIFFTARQFDAHEAWHMGLINRAVPVAELEAFVDDYVARIVANAPLTIAAADLCIREALKPSAARDVAACTAAIERCMASEDYREGRRAFMEKRKPDFRGR